MGATGRKGVRGVAIGALLVAVLGVSVWAPYSRDIRAARARVATGSQVAQTACGPIEYAVAGEGPPLLIVHGAGGGFDQGLEFGAPLRDAGFRLIAPSRFGYLGTPMPADASPQAQAEAHACLLDTLGLNRVAVLGGSAGAPSAMELCLRHPERCNALVLLVPLAWTPGPAKPLSRAALTVIDTTLRSDFVFWAATRLAPDTLIQTVLGTPAADFQRAAPEEQARVLAVLHHILPVRPRRLGLLADGAVAAALPRLDLERFTTPTLVVSAEDDLYGTFTGGRHAAERIPGARFVGYPDGGHLLVGHSREAAEAMAAFLRQTGAGAEAATPEGP